LDGALFVTLHDPRRIENGPIDFDLFGIELIRQRNQHAVHEFAIVHRQYGVPRKTQ
jgi:hypothetical protein